jgi:formate dehydrogenase (NADP+) alpha subunit
MVSLTIDGRNVAVPKGTTILDAAAELGIKIPTLCWLKKVSPTGACRVCVVDVEGVDRPQTACNTPVKEGIAVTTSSEKLESIRKRMVELLLVNHPLDCPVCDAAGECDLQDSCYGLGVTTQDYAALPQKKPIRYDWPLIESDPNRCILCEKCVKVDHEIVRSDAIDVTCRGEDTIIDTVDGKPLSCEFCGNCVGSCPVGALIHKPSKFRGRPWAFTVTKSVCAFCSAGCQLEYHVRNGRVERTTSSDDNFNSGNLCINGRYGYAYLNSPQRLTRPMVKAAGVQAATDWNTAMATAAGKLKDIVAAHGPDAVAGIGSPRVTNEESYLFQKLFRAGIGTNNIDSEARFGYAAAQDVLRKSLGLTGASASIDRIDEAGAILVFGTDLNAESTGVEYRVIKAATKKDARLVVANMRDVKLKKIAHSHLKYRPGSELYVITALAKLIVEAGYADTTAAGFDAYRSALAAVSLAEAAEKTGVSEADLREAAAHLSGKKSVAVIFGSDVIRTGSVAETVAALVNLALVAGALGRETGGLFPIDEKNNTQGLLDMGVAPGYLPGYRDLGAAPFAEEWGKGLPSTPGKDLWKIVEGIEQETIKGLYVLGSDPAGSFPDSARIRLALEKLDLLIVQDILPSATTALADVVFSASAAAEKTGTFTTVDNRVQQLGKALHPAGDAREDWDILAEFYGRLAGTSRQRSTAEIRAEIARLVPAYGESALAKKPYDFSAAKPAFAPVAPSAAPVSGFRLLAGPILYHNGATSTFSDNNREVSPSAYVEIAAADAARLGIAEGGTIKVTTAQGSVTAPAKVTERVQPGLLFAPWHFRETAVTALLRGGSALIEATVEKG